MNNENTSMPSNESCWGSKVRRIGFNLSKLTNDVNLSVLTNTERLIARLGSENHLNGIKIVAASRWCSTVNIKLTPAQINDIVLDCRSDENLAALVFDPIAYFDKISGYVHAKPTSKRRQAINTGVFANLNAA